MERRRYIVLALYLSTVSAQQADVDFPDGGDDPELSIEDEKLYGKLRRVAEVSATPPAPYPEPGDDPPQTPNGAHEHQIFFPVESADLRIDIAEDFDKKFPDAAGGWGPDWFPGGGGDPPPRPGTGSGGP